ncbi:MAG: hypothetical protein KDA91_02935 [Planctomycetaceae bacterium]|nr:hypothetical protein [Planctomycetaceae bacterium]
MLTPAFLGQSKWPGCNLIVPNGCDSWYRRLPRLLFSGSDAQATITLQNLPSVRCLYSSEYRQRVVQINERRSDLEHSEVYATWPEVTSQHLNKRTRSPVGE